MGRSNLVYWVRANDPVQFGPSYLVYTVQNMVADLWPFVLAPEPAVQKYTLFNA